MRRTRLCGTTRSETTSVVAIGRNSSSVSITMQYRAIYTVDGTDNVWYWIGTHADYDVFIGKK